MPNLNKVKIKKTGPNPSCSCGECLKCRNRQAARKAYYNKKNREKTKESHDSK